MLPSVIMAGKSSCNAVWFWDLYNNEPWKIKNYKEMNSTGTSSMAHSVLTFSLLHEESNFLLFHILPFFKEIPGASLHFLSCLSLHALKVFNHVIILNNTFFFWDFFSLWLCITVPILKVWNSIYEEINWLTSRKIGQ